MQCHSDEHARMVSVASRTDVFAESEQVVLA